jgi:tetratricopeptide (TPR) repeat protein
MTSPAIDAELQNRAEPSNAPNPIRAEFEAGWIAESLATDGIDATLASAVQRLAMRQGDISLQADLARLYRVAGRKDDELTAWQVTLKLVPQHAEASLRVALLQSERGEHADAERILRAALDHDPRDRGVVYALATVLMRQRRYQEALSAWTTLAAADTGAVEPLLGRARALHGLGQFDAARAVYAEARRGHPHNIDVLRGFAVLLGDMQRYDDAIGVWRRIASLRPSEIDPLVQIALLHSRAERVAEASLAATEILRREPNNVAANRLLGALYRRTKQFDAALNHLRTALAGAPNDLATLRLLGRIFSKTGNQQGLEIWAKVASLDGSSLEPWLELGRLAAKLGRHQIAAEAFNQALKRDADHAEARQGLDRATALLQRRPLPTHREAAAAQSAPPQAAQPQPAAPHPENRIEQLCVNANAKLLAGDFAAAEALASEAHKLDRAHVLPQRLLGYVMVRAGRWSEARAVWDRLAAEPRADRSEALFNLGRAQHALKNAGEAIVALREARKLKPAHQPTAYLLARVLVEADRDDEAASIWDELLQSDPEAIEPPLGHARIAMRRGDWTAAEQWVDRVLLRAPDHVESLIARAQIHATRQRWPEALTAWDAALAADGASLVAQSGRAQTLLALNRPVEAADGYRAVLKHRPDDVIAQAGFGRAAFQLGRHEESAEAWSRVLAADADNVEACVFLGRIAEQTWQAEEAERRYRSALAKAPGDRVALTLLGRMLSSAQRYAEAAPLWEKLRAAAPEGAESWRRLGQVRESAGDVDAAIEFYREAIKRQPHDIHSNLRLAALLHHKQMTDAAIHVLERLTTLRPDRPDGWHYLLALLAAAGRPEAAREALAKAQDVVPCDVSALAALGRAAEAAQLTDEAEAIFHKIVELFSGEGRSHEELGRFYLRQGRPLTAYRRLKRGASVDPADASVSADLVALRNGLKLLGVDADGRQMTLDDLRLPEDLFPHVVRMAGQAKPSYQPVARRIAVCAASLAPGRAQRQLVRMLGHLADPKWGLDRVGLFAQTLNERDRSSFYLPHLRDKPIDIKDATAVSFEALLAHPQVAQFADLIRLFPRGFGHSVAAWVANFAEFRPAIVHGWQNEAGLAAAVAGLLVGAPRIVLTGYGAHPEPKFGRAPRYLESGYRALLAAPNVLLACDSAAAASDYAEWLGCSADAIRVIQGGADLRRLDQPDATAQAARHRAMLGIPETAPVVGGVFRFSEEKQPVLWIETAAEIARTQPNAHFVVCGEGPYRTRMRERAAELGLGERLHMPGGQREIGSWYAMMTVLLSTAARLGPSEVLAEAQHLGVPVVAPSSGGAPEAIEDGVTGWCVNNADARSLAARVSSCLSDADWRAACRERARSAAARFGMDAMICRVLEIYGLEQPAKPAAKRPRAKRARSARAKS